jgi:hypothetical protein
MRIAGAVFNLKGNANGLGGENMKILVNLNASGIDLGELLKSVSGKEELKGARSEVIADFQASGRSPANLASTLNGHVRVSVGLGQVHNRNLDDLLGDVFADVINTIDPFYTKENKSELKCLVINVPVKNGVVLIDDTVALETKKVIVDFLKTTVMGGLFVLLPVLLLYMLLAEALQMVVALATPIVDLFPKGVLDRAEAPVLIALILIVAASFLLGLALRSASLSRLGDWIDTTPC